VRSRGSSETSSTRSECARRKPRMADWRSSSSVMPPTPEARTDAGCSSGLHAYLMRAAPDHASDWYVACDHVDIGEIADLGQLGEHP
jgi:hypothetical protein